ATSMIGFIALAGIIVRNSILLVDYSRQEISRGVEIKEAIIMACITRTRPIIITALALVVGSTAILMDPIFQGMAVSLMFGVFVSTILTLIVIPLGCYSARDAFCDVMREDHPDYQLCVEERETLKKKDSSSGSVITKILFSTYSIIVTVVQVVWWSLQGLYTLVFKRKKAPDVAPQSTAAPESSAAPEEATKNSDMAAKSEKTPAPAPASIPDKPEAKTSEVDKANKSSAPSVSAAERDQANAAETDKVAIPEPDVSDSAVSDTKEKTAVKKQSAVKKKAAVRKKSVSSTNSKPSGDEKKLSTVKKTVKKKGRRGIQLKGDLGGE
ncbi:MAG: efflux RND transporter permease subunit, partial [Thiotrichaceae bacterium]|nr:efflux RND transporter permease subunit [Thiotrichaceae bacterium]